MEAIEGVLLPHFLARKIRTTIYYVQYELRNIG